MADPEPGNLACGGVNVGKDDLCRFARQVTQDRLLALLAETEGVQAGEDIEHVHRMRVASRRLRSALRLFRECFKGKKVKRWREAAKEVTSSLGEARDLDVQMEFLAKLEEDWGERGLEIVIERLRTRRAELQPGIASFMDRLTSESPLLDLRAELEDLEEWDGEASDLHSHAHAHASIAVEELFAHADSVPVFEDWQGHHALRIAGKRLRYTLEAFRGAYEDRLDEEIKALRGLQDVVGDLHDCDVWLQRLPDMMKKAPDALQALARLQEHMEGRRRELHQDLVESWYGLQQERFFYRLLERLKERGVEEVCPITVALVSDVHGNEAALRAVLAHARERGATAVLHAGDAVGPPRPRQAIGLLQEMDVLSVFGNMDREALEARKGRGGKADPHMEFVLREMDDASWDWLASLPQEVRLDICGRTLYMTHGAPGDDRQKLLLSTPDSRLKGIAQDVKADVIVTGHSHLPMGRKIARTLFVNPGSVGRPRGGPQASYATLTFPWLDLQHHLVEYDADRTADEVRALGFVDLAKDVGEGRKNDRTAEVGKWAMTMLPDQEHVEQVRMLALLLFDQLRGLHRLKEGDRELLEMAALVHDVGLCQGVQGHQRRALDLIMQAELTLDLREKMILACVSRYHGCRPPCGGDRVFKDLRQRDRKRVRKLSALLAIADALDRGHVSRVSGISAEIGKKEVRLVLAGQGPFSLEREWVGYKQCQFEKVFGRSVCLAE